MTRWISGGALAALMGLGGCGGGGENGGENGGDAGSGEGGGVVTDRTVVVDAVDDVVVEADRLLFPRATHADLLQREPGDLLVGDRAQSNFASDKNPDGFLRRVVRVGATEEWVVVDTELAYLTDVIAEGTFQRTFEPIDVGELPPVPLVLDRKEWLSAEPGSPAAAGLIGDLPLEAEVPRLTGLGVVNFSGLKFGPETWKPAAPLKVTIKGIPTNIEPSATITLTVGKGKFVFNPSTDLGIDIGLIDGLREFRFALSGALTAEMSSELDLELALKAGVDFGSASDAEKKAINEAFEDWALNGGGFPEFSSNVTSASVNLPTWWLPTTPPLPVVSTLRFDLRLACNVARLRGSAKAQVSADGAGQMTLGGLWRKDEGWTAINDRSWDVESEERSLTGAIALTAGCSLKPRLELIFYGMAGPNIYVNATNEIELKAAQKCPGVDHVPKTDVTLGITNKLAAGIGARLGIIAAGINYTLAEANMDLLTINNSLGPWTLWSGHPKVFGGFGWCSENEPTCGDGTCDDDEDCESCAEDCACDGDCGDGVCGDGETCGTCPADCGACGGFCGDGACGDGETCGTCPADCGVCPPTCGDNHCTGSETCGNCPQDCGQCPATCGNGACDGGETCGSCPQDCGACPPTCGDGLCNGGETCGSCQQDCGACPDPCANANDGNGWYCGKNIGGITKALYYCVGGATSNTQNCAYGCAGCAPGEADVCKDFPDQSDNQACSDGPVCNYYDQNVCGGAKTLWCSQGQCKSCTPGFSNCDGTQGCECNGYCGEGNICCDFDACTAECPIC